jgi:plastocyanin
MYYLKVKAIAVVLSLFWLSRGLGAVELNSIQFLDLAGKPVANVVIEMNAEPIGESLPVANNYIMDQVDYQFSPLVLVVPKSAAVQFPNSDESRHHVYSFSEAKQFELKLYAGNQAPPVVFDNAGIVVLGCNIHDRMNAHIYVTDAPIVAKSDQAGQATIPKYQPSSGQEIRIWHPLLMQSLVFELANIDIDRNKHASLTLPIALPEEEKPKNTSDLRNRLKSFKSNGN